MDPSFPVSTMPRSKTSRSFLKAITPLTVTQGLKVRERTSILLSVLEPYQTPNPLSYQGAIFCRQEIKVWQCLSLSISLSVRHSFIAHHFGTIYWTNTGTRNA